MKAKLNTLTIIFSILSVIITSISACSNFDKDASPQSLFTIKITYVDGYSENLTWKLPSESRFYIGEHRGSYYLDATFDRLPERTTLKNGVLRYKILKIQNIK